MVTHHHCGTAAETFTIVVCGNNLKREVGPAHVSKHDGRLDDSRVGLDDKAVLALWCGWYNQPVCHLTVIPSVLISCLQHTSSINNKKSENSYSENNFLMGKKNWILCLETSIQPESASTNNWSSCGA